MTSDSSVPPKSSKPSSIRRRPRSVDEFIATGADDVPSALPPSAEQDPPATPPSAEQDQSATPPPAEREPPGAAATPSRFRPLHYMVLLGVLLGAGALAMAMLEWQRGSSLEQGLADLRQTFQAWTTARSEDSAVQPAAATVPPPPTPGPSFWLRWFALSDLQLARQSLADGHAQRGFDSLASAQAHLARLGQGAAAEQALLQDVRARIAAAPVLSLEQLELGLEQLEAVWLRVTYGSVPGSNEADDWFRLPAWLSSPWQTLSGSGEPPETTDSAAGRDLSVRLERLRRLAQRGDQTQFRSAAMVLEQWLAPSFQDHPEGPPWLAWIQRLEQVPLQRDLSDLDGLIVQLSAYRSQELCASAAAAAEPCETVQQ